MGVYCLDMKGETQTVNGVEATYKNAIITAYNAAELKAYDVPQNPIGHPVDHAAQASLENSQLTGQRFESAYEEVWTTIYSLSDICDSTDEMAEKLDQIRTELLRVTYDN
jgi:hypothetical protein